MIRVEGPALMPDREIVRFAGNDRVRVVEDADGHVFDCVFSLGLLCWGPWRPVNTRAFDEYARAVMR